TLSANCGDNIEGILGANLPTAIDNCSDVIVTISSEETTEGDCTGSYLRTVGYVVSDSCGNVNATIRFVTIMVTDTDAPVWDGEDVELTADCAADIDSLLAEHVPTATDNCSDVIIAVSSDETTAGNCTGSYVDLVGYVVSDSCGNVNTTTRFVTIVVTDTDAPI